MVVNVKWIKNVSTQKSTSPRGSPQQVVTIFCSVEVVDLSQIAGSSISNCAALKKLLYLSVYWFLHL